MAAHRTGTIVSLCPVKVRMLVKRLCSLLHGINTKGLVKHVQKHSKGVATVKALSEEIVVYDLTVFNKIIIYVGGNDCPENRSDRI